MSCYKCNNERGEMDAYVFYSLQYDRETRDLEKLRKINEK